ncbi:MAG: glutamate-cysteine ligase family protein [Caldilineaceae bacterium]
MTPVIIALCGNSPVFGGKPSPYCSAREGDGQHLQLGAPPRHAARSMRDIADYVATTAETTYLIVRGDHEIYPSSQPFSAYLEEHGADYLRSSSSTTCGTVHGCARPMPPSRSGPRASSRGASTWL